MRRNFRAMAFAAAVVSFGVAATYAGPTLASEADAAPAISPTQHAAETLILADTGLNSDQDQAQLAFDVDFSNPIAAHAVADNGSQPSAFAGEEDVRDLGDLVLAYKASETPDEETECLARAVYFESKGEPLSGQLAVAEVILNRAKSGRFPSTLCGVVRQPSQFSFVRRGHIPQPPLNEQWRTAVAIARIAQSDLADGGAPSALFFHARYVSPGWRNLTRVATVGNHIFYR